MGFLWRLIKIFFTSFGAETSNNKYDTFNFEEEELEDDDFYFEDDKE